MLIKTLNIYLCIFIHLPPKNHIHLPTKVTCFFFKCKLYLNKTCKRIVLLSTLISELGVFHAYNDYPLFFTI